MSTFFRQLEELQPESTPSVWVYVPYDQLTDQIGPLGSRPSESVGVVLVETTWKAARRPYHKQKLAFILANQRHFALEQARRGVAVRYLISEDDYATTLRPVASELGGLTMMEAAEWELRDQLADLVEDGLLTVVDHDGWLTTPEQFHAGASEVPWRMDSFYRHVRRETGLLMEDGAPLGGQYSHDGDNREFWPGEPKAPEVPKFGVDAVTEEVFELVDAHFGHHPGSLEGANLPVTKEHADQLWEWAKAECMEHFGPYEDAMSTRSRGIFHTRISPLLNVHRLLPAKVVDEVAELELPLNSKEGFIRQVIGWREFMRHVHAETDGFRRLPDGVECSTAPSTTEADDGGWSTWSGSTWNRSSGPEGSRPSFLQAREGLPPAFWGEPSGLACLDTVVESVWDEAYSHHITRLMVLANIATLLDYSPRETTDWFWSAYLDAFDWVVEPNVLGMGMFALGELFTTKPYVSGSNYIHKMSDYCGDCAFHPKKNCPIGDLYWAFLERHHERLDGNRRMNLVFGSLRRRSDAKKERDREVFEWVRTSLAARKKLVPDDLPEAR